MLVPMLIPNALLAFWRSVWSPAVAAGFAPVVDFAAGVVDFVAGAFAAGADDWLPDDAGACALAEDVCACVRPLAIHPTAMIPIALYNIFLMESLSHWFARSAKKQFTRLFRRSQLEQFA